MPLQVCSIETLSVGLISLFFCSMSSLLCVHGIFVERWLLILHSAAANFFHHCIKAAEQCRGRCQAEYSNYDVNWGRKNKKNRSNQQNSEQDDFTEWTATVCFVVPLTKDVVEVVHEDQHPTHHGDKDDDFEGRVQEKLSTVCFTFTPSFPGHALIQPLSATNTWPVRHFNDPGVAHSFIRSHLHVYWDFNWLKTSLETL